MEYYKSDTIVMAVFEFVGAFFEIVALVYFISLVSKKQLTPGDYFAYIGMKSFIIGAFNGFAKINMHYKNFDVAVEDMNRIINIKDLIGENSGDGIVLNEKINKISLNNVSFNYDEKRFVYNFNHDFLKGNIYVLFGANGIGKTTLIRLLTSLCKPQKGDVLINDKYSIGNLDEGYLFHKIKVLSQTPVLYDDSLMNNICLGKLPKDEFGKRFSKLAKHFNTEDIIGTYEKGLESNIFEGGKKLSGGQTKKIALLNLFMEDADLLIFDEPFAELDRNMKIKFYNYLKEISKDKIIIMISHDYDWNWSAGETFLYLEEGAGKSVYLANVRVMQDIKGKILELTKAKDEKAKRWS